MKLIYALLVLAIATMWFNSYPSDEAAIRTAICAIALAILFFLAKFAWSGITFVMRRRH